MLLLALSPWCVRRNVNIVCCVRATRSEDESPEVRWFMLIAKSKLSRENFRCTLIGGDHLRAATSPNTDTREPVTDYRSIYLMRKFNCVARYVFGCLSKFLLHAPRRTENNALCHPVLQFQEKPRKKKCISNKWWKECAGDAPHVSSVCVCVWVSQQPVSQPTRKLIR